MRLLVIFIAVSAVVAIPFPAEPDGKSQGTPPPIDPSITWDTMPVRLPKLNYVPPKLAGRDRYDNQPNKELPDHTSGANWRMFSQDSADDPAGYLFGELQTAADTTEDYLQQVPGVAALGSSLQSAADITGDVLQQFPGAAALGAGAAAVYTFFNPPGSSAAPADASAGP